ncbi:MAG: tRNA (N(6)-L-threonylcarbamoyladenosine(37)-C(2))-methylthiotransferase MtaB [Opitutales bacterium]|nr:tRNA (N(6)-L-threonylcarbamoyladenosine(37)-C(2))-methylthiotransferase MtaB [Opitutales bacterium]
MKIYVHTHGCRLNAAESRTIVEQLEAKGYTIVPELDLSVDVAIVNTCAVTALAESKCRQTLRQIVRQNPRIHLLVTGCLAENAAESLKAIHPYICVIGNVEKSKLVEHLEQVEREQQFPYIFRSPLPKSEFRIGCALGPVYEKRYNLKIQEGCDFCCSYCIIPRLRGRSRSRAFDDLLQDAAEHVKKGVKEIILTGVNIGTYSSDGKDLSDVIQALSAIPGLLRIRLSSIELKTIPQKIFEQMRDPQNKLVRYLHVPLQSGSDRILRKMRRHYNLEEARIFFEKAAATIPNVGLGTDIIVGFPGETEEDFQASVDFFEQSPLQYAHVFSYSRRPGTVADLSHDFVMPAGINRRSQQLRALSAQKRRHFLECYLSKKMDVLFEDREPGGFHGLTENYIKVWVPDPGHDLTNQLHKVTLTRISEEGVMAELVDEK